MAEFDSPLNEKAVTDITHVLQDTAWAMGIDRKPLDTSAINAALIKLPNEQDQVNALCKAVNDVNPKETQDPNHQHRVPLYIGYETAGKWASIHVYTGFSVTTDPTPHAETLYILPLKDPDNFYKQNSINKECFIPPLFPPVEKQANVAPPAPGTDPHTR